jgi:hypothetical protein
MENVLKKGKFWDAEHSEVRTGGFSEGRKNLRKGAFCRKEYSEGMNILRGETFKEGGTI